MATSKATIQQWFNRGRELGATHLIVVCDTFDHDDYPVYVSKSEDVKAKMAGYNAANMQRIMEVYNLSMDRDTQLNERRAFNY